MPPRPAASPDAELRAEPRQFHFDAAVRVLNSVAKTADPAEAARFRSAPGLAYPAAEVAALETSEKGKPPELRTPAIGLTGAAGVLPRLYTDVLTGTLRGRSDALHDFLDMLSHRIVAMFAGAGIKYRLHRTAETAATAGLPEADPVSDALLALTGFATPNLVSRLAVGPEPLLHYSGFYAGRPRSAERLEALVSDWLGRKVEVIQFAGAWLPLPPDQRSSMPKGRRAGTFNRLGVDAVAGVRAWDPQARIILRVGPLDYRSFAALLPDRTGLQRLVSLVRAYLGYETGFAINPVLKVSEIPPLQLDPAASVRPRLGWNTWMPAPAAPVAGIERPDADEAVFEAEIVEAEELVGRRSN